jgi:hypothetical protein
VPLCQLEFLLFIPQPDCNAVPLWWDSCTLLDVRVHLTKQPFGMVSGVSLRHYRAGHVYDVSPELAEYLVIEGFGLLEMRRTDDAGQRIDRRKRRRT